jgi:erythromycin esterase-like protein
MQSYDVSDLSSILAMARSARVVLIGEASHGTEEFYATRAEITKRLLMEFGFRGVAVEADWPDAYRVNRWVQGADNDRTAEECLDGFERFPRWMWRNTVVRDFVAWLREYNRRTPQPAGFYGLDLYSLHGSRRAVIEYLDTVDPAAARDARERYSCFDHFHDPQDYGYNTSLGISETCKADVVKQLLALQTKAAEYRSHDGVAAEDEFFFAQQNAVLVRNAEEYYRTMFAGRVSSWNVRDRHMFETLQALLTHLGRKGSDARVVVWAHNSHLGDARATEMSKWGELNLGQLVRENYGEGAVNIGFTTYTGTVMAADNWDETGRIMKVRPGMRGSYEDLFHREGEKAFLVPIRGYTENVRLLSEPRLERAIGVIYRPESERASHYFEARLAQQFDTVIHLDTTRALATIGRGIEPVPEEAPETFPSGM